jgi:hypothetical protein
VAGVVTVTVFRGTVKQFFVQFVGLFPGQVPEESTVAVQIAVHQSTNPVLIKYR